MTRNSIYHSLYRSTLLLVALLFCCHLGYGKVLEAKETKEINKTFRWSPASEVEISNKYGEITITHWAKSEVAMRIVIEAKARNQELAKETLDRISVDFSDAAGSISAQTQIAPEKKGWGVNFGGDVQFNIRYYVSLPAEAICDLEQKYGNILMLERHTGNCTIEAKYGNIELGDLGGLLSLTSKYGNVKMGNFTRAELDLGYSGNVRVGSGEALDIEAKYSNIWVKDVKWIDMDIKYGQLEAGNISHIELDSKYSNITLEELQESFVASELDYGKLIIQQVGKDFLDIDIEARYSTVELNIPASSSFSLDAEGFRYASCKIRGFNNMNNFEQDEDRTSCTVNGGKKGKISFEGNGYSNLIIKGE